MTVLYVVYGILSVLLAAIVAAEMATYSTRRERLIQMASEGNRNARMALIYLRSPRHYLAGSQLAATLVATILGLLSGQLFSQPLTEWYRGLGLTNSQAGQAGFWTATIVLTILSTIFINLLPKRFAFSYADDVAVFHARIAWMWIKFTKPILFLLNSTVDLIANRFHVRPAATSEITERDIVTLLIEGRKDRLIDPHEFVIVRSALALSDKKVSEIMTPRAAVKWIDVNDSEPQQIEEKLRCGRSQIPIAEKNLDNVESYVSARKALSTSRNLSPADLKKLAEPIVRVPKSASALSVLNTLREGKSRLAIVSDDHGHVLGLVSLNDLVMAVLGEFESLKD